jgi:hypothetical protein
MEIDDAVYCIIEFVRLSRMGRSDSQFGYELYLPPVMLAYMKENQLCPEDTQYITDCPGYRGISSTFYDAAWELCRRGILRPTVQFVGGHGNTDGGGYSLTALGQRWIDEGPHCVFVGSVDRLSELFTKLADRLGAAFLQRAIEAARCHSLGTYIACCAMCGAAAESILLTVANAKRGDEAAVLATYRAAQGRRKVIEGVIGNAKPAIAEPFRSATGLLSYWRDEAAHGLASTISEIEAHEALGRLIRFAQFANDNWAELTRPSSA